MVSIYAGKLLSVFALLKEARDLIIRNPVTNQQDAARYGPTRGSVARNNEAIWKRTIQNSENDIYGEKLIRYERVHGDI